MRIDARHRVHNVDRPIEQVFQVGEDVPPHGERASDLRTHRCAPWGGPRRTTRWCASSTWKKVFVHVEEAHRTYQRLDASGWVHHVGQPIANVYEGNEPFLTSACTAPYDREKQCPRAVAVGTTTQERLTYDRMQQCLRYQARLLRGGFGALAPKYYSEDAFGMNAPPPQDRSRAAHSCVNARRRS